MDEVFTLETKSPSQAIEITEQVAGVVARAGIDSGLCHVMVLHSTAAIVIRNAATSPITSALPISASRSAASSTASITGLMDSVTDRSLPVA